MFVGSLITRCKPHCHEKFSIALHSILIKSFLHQLLDFALKSPRRTIEKVLYKIILSQLVLLHTQDLAQGFL